MRTINESTGYDGTEFYVLKLDNEPVLIHFGKQIDDLLISSPDKDVLISWDVDEWNDTKNLLIKTYDNLKELNNLRCTKLIVKTKDELPAGEIIPVWITIQRN